VSPTRILSPSFSSLRRPPRRSRRSVGALEIGDEGTQDPLLRIVGQLQQGVAPRNPLVQDPQRAPRPAQDRFAPSEAVRPADLRPWMTTSPACSLARSGRATAPEGGRGSDPRPRGGRLLRFPAGGVLLLSGMGLKAALPALAADGSSGFVQAALFRDLGSTRISTDAVFRHDRSQNLGPGRGLLKDRASREVHRLDQEPITGLYVPSSASSQPPGVSSPPGPLFQK